MDDGEASSLDGHKSVHTPGQGFAKSWAISAPPSSARAVKTWTQWNRPAIRGRPGCASSLPRHFFEVPGKNQMSRRGGFALQSRCLSPLVDIV